MKQYELVVLFPVSENEVAAEKKISDLCKKLKIKVVGLDKWGTKPLAYLIGRENKAYYLFYSLETDSEEIKKLEAALKIDESILRWLLVKI